MANRRNSRDHRARLFGQEAFSGEPPRLRVRDPYLNKIAVWTYYDDPPIA